MYALLALALLLASFTIVHAHVSTAPASESGESDETLRETVAAPVELALRLGAGKGDAAFRVSLADGVVVEVDLEQNVRLLSPNYKEYEIGVDMVVTEKKVHSADAEKVHACHFIGRVRGHRGVAAFSTCDGGLVGFVVLGTTQYGLVYAEGQASAQSWVERSEATSAAARRALDNSESKMDTLLYPAKPKTIVREEAEEASTPSASTAAAADGDVGVQPAEKGGLFPLDGVNSLIVEVVVVSDVQHIALFPANATLVSESNLRVMNQVASFYAGGDFSVPVFISVAAQVTLTTDFGIPLIGGETNATTLLLALNDFRRGLLDGVGGGSIVSHDIMHLFSGKDFLGGTIGLARLFSVCDESSKCGDGNDELADGFCFVNNAGTFLNCCARNAGAISEVSPNRELLSATSTFSTSSFSSSPFLRRLTTNFVKFAAVAHEFGHQLGMFHDSQDSALACPSTGFIMAAFAPVSPSSDDTWSSCSESAVRNLISLAPDPNTGFHPYECLLNIPTGGVLGGGSIPPNAAATHSAGAALLAPILFGLLR